MRFVLPGQETLEALERVGTTERKCHRLLEEVLCSEEVQLCVFENESTLRQSNVLTTPADKQVSASHTVRKCQICTISRDRCRGYLLNVLNGAQSIYGS